MPFDYKSQETFIFHHLFSLLSHNSKIGREENKGLEIKLGDIRSSEWEIIKAR
ncbi:hypothetical protein Syun_027189 [Stephania yunnanensis]|uniref:Uncharacterized protein n=1 Tax=Stephania yunnanensis TaxID=152371 RepID=A0AAP0HKU6_9MAGN